MQTRDTDATRATPSPKPSNDALARLMAPSYETNELWDTRSATNKAMRALDGAVPRLGGLSQICFGLSFAEIAKGANSGGEALHSPYYYIATALADIAKSLQAAHRLWWDAANGEDEAPPKQKRSAKPTRKRANGRASA